MWTTESSAEALSLGASVFVLCGDLRRDETGLHVDAAAGRVTIEGQVAELDALEAVLAGCNGRRTLDDALDGSALAAPEVARVLCALAEVGGVFNLSSAWRYFHAVSSNPPPDVPHHPKPLAAYDMPRYRLPGEVVGPLPASSSFSVTRLARDRRSADLDAVPCDARASLAAALQYATDAYSWLDGRRPAPSGGALYPLHFWVIGGESEEASWFAVDHDEGVLRKVGMLSRSQLADSFVRDQAVADGIERGAAVIVIGADPRRTTFKYGNRGWRYALIEAGAVMQQISLLAVEDHAALRPIGGFLDEALSGLCAPGILAVLALLVMKA